MPKRTKEYDNVFKTLKMKHKRLFIPIINNAFGKNFPMNAVAEVLPSEGYLTEGETRSGDRKIEERISDFLLRIEGETYLLECQSYEDDSMAIRVSEYTFLAARQCAVWDAGHAILPMPGFLVIYLKGTDRTPRKTALSYAFPDGQRAEYESENVILAELTKEEIMEKRLFAYIPFYIARYEKEIASEGSVEDVERDLKYMKQEMLRLYEAGELTDYELIDLCGFVNTIITHIADGNQNEERLVKIMGGTILETESERLIREGMERGLSQGMERGFSQGMERGLSQGMERGFSQGMERGLSQGMSQGQSSILALNNILLSQDRVEDLRRASEDAEYRRQLLEEYSIL